MPKVKSEKALLKEQKTREKIAKHSKTMTLKEMYYVPLPAVSKVKIKSPHNEILVRKGKLPAFYAAWWLRLKAEYGSALPYILLPSQKNIDDITIFKPITFMGGKSDTVVIDGKVFRREFCNSDVVERVLSSPFHRSAVAMTWPDDLGNVKMYMHQSSWATKFWFPKLFVPSDGVNWSMLASTTDWGHLEKYLKIHNDTVELSTVCAIVKTISRNMLAAHVS
jgi:hypothetical protein